MFSKEILFKIWIPFIKKTVRINFPGEVYDLIELHQMAFVVYKSPPGIRIEYLEKMDWWDR